MVSVYTFKWLFLIACNAPHKYLITLDCSGKGMKENPYIIDNTVKPPQLMIIENSTDYILIENCKFSQVYIDTSSNVQLRNIRTERLTIKKSLNIRIEKCSISGILQFKQTDTFSVSNCEIDKLKLTKIKSRDSLRRNITATNNVKEVFL